MPDKTQLPFLLKLIDDPSPTVRDKVAQRLRLYGPLVWQHAQELGLPLNGGQRAALRRILAAGDDDALRQAWPSWLKLAREADQIEEAFGMLADWQLGRGHAARQRRHLSALGHEFQASHHVPDYHALSRFLFVEKGLRGAPPDDYYNPLNSNLLYVLEEGHGLPISLACTLMLVGARVGLTFRGCNFPGHFLASAHDGQREWFFDCYHGGRTLSGAEMVTHRKVAPLEMSHPAAPAVIMARVLKNLSVAYYEAGEVPAARFMLELMEKLV